MNLVRGLPLATAVVLALTAGACNREPAARGPKSPSRRGGVEAPSCEKPKDPPPEPSAKLDEIIVRYIEARGGMKNLSAIRSLRLTGTAKFGDGNFLLEAGYGLEQKRPGSIRTEVTFQGLTGVDAYDGSV